MEDGCVFFCHTSIFCCSPSQIRSPCTESFPSFSTCSVRLVVLLLTEMFFFIICTVQFFFLPLQITWSGAAVVSPVYRSSFFLISKMNLFHTAAQGCLHSSSAILINPITFRETARVIKGEFAFLKDLSLFLGLTNPLPAAVHMEPFSASIFRKRSE